MDEHLTGVKKPNIYFMRGWWVCMVAGIGRGMGRTPAEAYERWERNCCCG